MIPFSSSLVDGSGDPAQLVAEGSDPATLQAELTDKLATFVADNPLFNVVLNIGLAGAGDGRKYGAFVTVADEAGSAYYADTIDPSELSFTVVEAGSVAEVQAAALAARDALVAANTGATITALGSDLAGSGNDGRFAQLDAYRVEAP